MSSFDYYPDSLPTMLFDNRRQPGGLYNHMVEILSNMRKSAFCNVNMDVDFFRRKKIDNWANHYGFRTGSNTEFNANIFGEIVGEQYGTLLGPTGNHFPGRMDEEMKPIADSSHIKPVIVLGKPSLCDEVLGDYFHDQIVVFNDIRRADEREEEQERQEFEAKEIIKGKDSEDSEPCLIVLHGQLLYSVERESGSGSSAKPQARVMTKRRADGARTSSASTAHVASDVSPSSALDVRAGRPLAERELPGVEYVRVGAKYSPWVIPGYGGPRFQQRLARAIQPDWRDAQGQLIPLWDVWTVLRPGTVIMANVVINVYIMTGGKGKRRKVYQAAIQSLRVLGRSDVPVDKPQANFDESESVRNQGQMLDDAASLALRNLVIPEVGCGSRETSVERSATEPNVESDSPGSGDSNVSRSVAGPSTRSSGPVDAVQQNNLPRAEFLEDTEMQFMGNTRGSKGKKARRS
ncbi:hypothetical protein V5O48_003720 [Marasmius crinis-equi]|uniref:Uncharacterized protein n=1 Tax=Marasmius crinis-equi TaxID=585013 RepID=A0ABR3FSF0_9AGAR